MLHEEIVSLQDSCKRSSVLGFFVVWIVPFNYFHIWDLMKWTKEKFPVNFLFLLRYGLDNHLIDFSKKFTYKECLLFIQCITKWLCSYTTYIAGTTFNSNYKGIRVADFFFLTVLLNGVVIIMQDMMMQFDKNSNCFNYWH